MKYLFLLLVLVSCDREHPVPQPLPIKQKSVKLLVFAAGYCEPCQHELPTLYHWWLTYPNHDKVSPIVYFVAGNPATVPATQSDAERFLKDLSVGFPTLADKYGKVYRSYYGTSPQVPAVIISSDEGVLKKYPPGIISIDVLEADIGRFLKTNSLFN